MLTSAPGEYTRPTNRQAEPEKSFLVPAMALLIQWNAEWCTRSGWGHAWGSGGLALVIVQFSLWLWALRALPRWGLAAERDRGEMHSVVLCKMVRVTVWVPASPGQTQAAESSCFANITVTLCSGGAPAPFPAYISTCTRGVLFAGGDETWGDETWGFLRWKAAGAGRE